jgi:hypothetical protein
VLCDGRDLVNEDAAHDYAFPAARVCNMPGSDNTRA